MALTQNGLTTSHQSEYWSYRQMLARCTNRNHPQFKSYGGRGIGVCARWRDSFILFIEDMGPKPDKSYSLDRILVNGNYEPSNCRWATNATQQSNRRNNVRIVHDGKSLTMAEWARLLGVNKQTISERIKRGYPFEVAIGITKHIHLKSRIMKQLSKEERKNRVVARGEHSNHSHVVVGEAMVRNENGEILIDVTGDATIRHLLETSWLDGKEVFTGEHADIKLMPGTYKYIPQVEFDPYDEVIRQVRD